MQYAFWRQRTPQAEIMPEPAAGPALFASAAAPGDIDLRAMWAAIVRRRLWIVGPTLLAAVLSLVAVNMITPRYKSEARILIDGRENVFLRPNADRSEDRSTIDLEAVTSQVQLVMSRDLAQEIIAKNKLAENPEFDPVLRGFSPLRTVLALIGIGRDPFRLTPAERVLDSYYERLTVYAVDKSRVLVIEFQSQNPELAARVANSIAEGYLTLQQTARQDQAKSAGQWLSGEIENLRKKVADAESRADDFRSRSSLFVGTNNTTLSNQQLGEINTQLTSARAQKSDAESRARAIRDMLQSGKPIEASEVLNSELIRRLGEQRATLRGQLAEQSATLLDGHPRIRELKAQLADLDRQLREEAGKVSRSLENDARIAGARVESLTASLDQLKRQATSSNGQDVQLRALEREAKAQRDLLESYLARYREATARESIDSAPSEGRVISRAVVSNTPAYPKKLPIVLIATFGTLLLTTGMVATGELLRSSGMRSQAPAAPAAPLQPHGLLAPPLAPRHTVAREMSELEVLADRIRQQPKQFRKIAVLGAGQGAEVDSAALALARLLARADAKVVLVSVSAAAPMLARISDDPGAPGLSDLIVGRASFGQIITRDRLSSLQLVGPGHDAANRELFGSPRLALVIDALLSAYDHLVLDASGAFDISAELLTAQATAIVVPSPALTPAEIAAACEQFAAVGFGAVIALEQPVDVSSGWVNAAA
jgi:uncharacterized protein involved in exopolysaccharide biosynthesis/Mrp family chromosome partitioning ATPase